VLFGLNGARSARENGDLIVIIDVLRAASTITTALNNGAEKVIVVRDIDQAIRLSQKYDNSILAGERRGLKIKGFQLNNSPLEFKREVVEGKTIIFTSSNCAPIVEEAKGSSKIVLACFLNISTVASYIKNLAKKLGKDISIIYAGRYGNPSSDDLYCAEILKSLIIGKLKKPPSTNIIKNFLKYTPAGIYLSSIGRSRDVDYCGNVDLINIVPIWIENGFISHLKTH